MRGVGVCRTCWELVARSGTCPTCRGPIDRSLAAFEAWEQRRLERRVGQWHDAGLVDERTRDRLFEAAKAAPAPSTEENQQTPDTSHALERGADELFGSTSAFFAELKTRYSGLAARVGEDAPPSSGDPARGPGKGDEGADAGRAVFGGGATVGAGLDALSELDDSQSQSEDAHEQRIGRFGTSQKPEQAAPLGALQVFWFIGAILVLAGSLMGVREAWRSLDGVLRPLVIAGALFAYHIAFVVLARMLARRSETTGRILGVIAVGLTPVVFVAVAVAAGMSRGVGIGSAALLLAASTATLSAAGRGFSRGVGAGLVMGLLPCLALEVPLGGQETSLIRLLVPIGALVPLAVAAVRARVAFIQGAGRKGRSQTSVAHASEVSAQVFAMLASASYGAIAVALYALFGGPNEAPLDAGRFGAPLLACVAWVGLASTIGWFAMAGGAMTALLPRAAPVLRIVLLSALVGAALTGSSKALGAGRTDLIAQGVLAFAPSAVLGLAALALAIEARKHALALHFAVPIAHLALLLDAFVLIDRGPAVWVASMALVPAALLLLAPHARSRGHRIGIGIWATISSLALIFMTLAFEDVANGARYVIATAVAALLAIAAHAGGRTTRPTQHYLGALLALIGACIWFIPARPESGWFTFTLALDGLAVGYGVLAFAYPSSATRGDGEQAIDLRPFDDVSLLSATLCVFISWLALAPSVSVGAGVLLPPALDATVFGIALPPSIGATVLALRSLRDRSRAVTFVSGLGLGVALSLAALAVGSTPNGLVLDIAVAPLQAASAIAQGTIVAGLSALFLLVPATLRAAPASPGARFGRPLFGFVPLPLGATGRLLLDGFGLAAAVYAAIGCERAIRWIGSGVFLSPERDLVVLGLVAIIVAVLAAFVGRGLELVRARGHVATLATGGAIIAVTAVAYRIGRPLPPAVVGWRLTLVLAGVWLLARLIVAKGPWIAKALERPAHGTHYHWVVHTGVLGLSGLLLVDVLLVGAPTWTRALAIAPPMLLVGGALGMFLLYRSSGWRAFLHVGLGSLLLLACSVAAQRNILGPALEPLDPPGGRWMPPSVIPAVRVLELTDRGVAIGAPLAWLNPSAFLTRGDTELLLWERAIVGASAFAASCAALLFAFSRAEGVRKVLASTLLGREESEHDSVETALLAWTCAGSAIAALALAGQPSIIGAIVLLGAGVTAVLARSHVVRAIAVVLAAPTLIHALAHARVASDPSSTIPTWAGPAIAALALVVVVAGTSAPWITGHALPKVAQVSKRSPKGRDPTALLATQLVAAAYACLAFEYAMATGGTMRPTGALWRVIDLATDASGGSFASSYALAVTLFVLTLASAAGAWSWRGALARATSIAPPLLLGWAAFAAAAARVYTTPSDVLPGLITRNGPLLGAALGGTAAVAHVTAIVLHQKTPDSSAGTRVGRDALLFASAAAMGLFVLAGEPGGVEVGLLGMVGLGTAIAVGIHAIRREGTQRHVYFVELLIVALYAFATRAMQLRPETDALLGLGYGFTLLGVATLARRHGQERVATATRRFLAFLPVIVALITMRGPASNTSALFAFGSSVLYFVVAMTEGSRAFGTLAAIAANVALVIFGLAQGLDGIEIWLGPLGLLVAAISQIFAPKLSHAARSAVRITGGALLYLPSGMKLALQLGAAEDATYSVVFGAVCLLGVVAGVALKVRAYLALATLSLTLDVIANLVYAGLRDHRLGFVLLSASGLFILGTMILVTLRRERARALAATVRSQLSGWD